MISEVKQILEELTILKLKERDLRYKLAKELIKINNREVQLHKNLEIIRNNCDHNFITSEEKLIDTCTKCGLNNY